MADDPKPLLIKRYASRRLYNTETSDYVTLEDIATFIRAGREVQIIAEHESRGESVLPIDVLTDLVRSYTTSAQSVVPQFLAASFEMLREGQSKLMENLTTLPNPMASMPGFEAMQRQQQAFLKSIMGGWVVPGDDAPGTAADPAAKDAAPARPARSAAGRSGEAEDLAAIRKQLADLQAKLSRL